jgi:hypothetical protein
MAQEATQAVPVQASVLSVMYSLYTRNTRISRPLGDLGNSDGMC